MHPKEVGIEGLHAGDDKIVFATEVAMHSELIRGAVFCCGDQAAADAARVLRIPADTVVRHVLRGQDRRPAEVWVDKYRSWRDREGDLIEAIEKHISKCQRR